MSHLPIVPLLSEYATKYYIEFRKTKFFNHITHGIIALHRLGADLQRIQRFINWYSPELELRNECNEDVIQEKEFDPSKLLGTGKSFFFLYDEYEKRLLKTGGSVEPLLAQNLPLLAHGLGGGAFHGLIHVGYGYAANSPEMVLEGLAYMHFANQPPTVSNDSPQTTGARPSRSILEVLDEVRCDKTIGDAIKNEILKQEWLNSNSPRFGYFMRFVMKHYGNELVNWANAIEPPSEAKADTKSLGKWLVNSALTVYAASEQRNDFFILHGVTSAWSLYQVLSLFNNDENKRDVIRHFLCALLAAYLIQGTPNLRLDWVTGDQEEPERSWDVLIERTLAEDHDEHVFKLVQVCHDMDLENSDSQLTHLYKKAASVALDYPLFFFNDA